MKAYDLLDVRLPVVIAGRGFEVRRIRLCDVLRILVRFEEHFVALTTAEKPDPMAVISKLDVNDTADLFAFCLDPYDPSHLRAAFNPQPYPGETDVDKLVARKLAALKKSAEVMTMIAAVNDLPRIWASVAVHGKPAEPGRVEPVATSKSKVPPLLRVIRRLALDFHVEPQAVMLWSYEAFLTLADAADEELELAIPSLLEAQGIDPDILDDSDIPVAPIRDLNKDVH